jgi:hypothetical protein
MYTLITPELGPARRSLSGRASRAASTAGCNCTVACCDSVHDLSGSRHRLSDFRDLPRPDLSRSPGDYCGRAGPHRPQLSVFASNQPLQLKQKIHLRFALCTLHWLCALFVSLPGQAHFVFFSSGPGSNGAVQIISGLALLSLLSIFSFVLRISSAGRSEKNPPNSKQVLRK